MNKIQYLKLKKKRYRARDTLTDIKTNKIESLKIEKKCKEIKTDK